MAAHPLMTVLPRGPRPPRRGRAGATSAPTTRVTVARREMSPEGAAWRATRSNRPKRRVRLVALRGHVRSAERVPVLFGGQWLGAGALQRQRRRGAHPQVYQEVYRFRMAGMHARR